MAGFSTVPTPAAPGVNYHGEATPRIRFAAEFSSTCHKCENNPRFALEAPPAITTYFLKAGISSKSDALPGIDSGLHALSFM
jgi:hypothetical protein